MLKNAENDAECKSLDGDSLVIEHVQVNRASTVCYRADGACGQINRCMNSPCQIERILTEKEQIIPKLEEEVAQ